MLSNGSTKVTFSSDLNFEFENLKNMNKPISGINALINSAKQIICKLSLIKCHRSVVNAKHCFQVFPLVFIIILDWKECRDS